MVTRGATINTKVTTEHRGPMVKTPSPHWGDLGFKSRTGYRLS